MIIFANNAVTTLAVALLSSQTTVQVLATTGELFPVPGVGEYFKLTLEDRRNRTIEICHCTGRSGDVLTIVRAQEDTLALNFAIGSTVANRFTRDSTDAILAQVPSANPWYLGPYATAPTLDNDGNPLVAGMQYFNTTDNIFYVWTGASWVDQNNGTNAISSVSGTHVLQDPSAGFDGIVDDFNLRYIDYAAAVQTPDVTIAEQFLVWLDGVRLKPGDDYTIPVLGTIHFVDPPTADQSFTGVWVSVVTVDRTIGIPFIFGGGSLPLAAGEQMWIQIPFACTINKATLTADVAATVVLDIWKDTYANFPPTIADTITAAAKPSLAAAVKSEDAVLTGWNKTVNAGDFLKVNVDSNDLATKLNLSLRATKT